MLLKIQYALAHVQCLGPSSHGDRQYHQPLFRRSVSILIVDESQDQAEMFATLLNIYGHDVVSVYTGSDALSISRQRGFEVIYICSSSNDIAPFDLVEKLKKLRHLTNTFFVALSGDTGLNYRTTALNVGFNYVVVKPAEIGDICAPVIDKASNFSK